MLITTKINKKILKKMVKRYLSNGFKVVDGSDELIGSEEWIEIEIKVEDLKPTSQIKIKIECDYCHNIYSIKYQSYNRTNKEIVNKDACAACRNIKLKESIFVKYGTTTTLYLPEIRKKTEETMMNKYGVTNPFNSPEIQKGIKEYWNQIYGVDNPSCLQYVVDKRTNTYIERFGTDNPSKLDYIKREKEKTTFKNYGVINGYQTKKARENSIKATLNKYGVEYVIQNEEEKEKLLTLSAITRSKNGTVISSKQQRYICDILNGELNYPSGRNFLDIAFPDVGIYIEYDGGGHDLCVTLNQITKEEFVKKERRRYFYNKTKGWKMIRMVSKNNKVIQKDILIDLFTFASQYLFYENWIIFNLDEHNIKSKMFELLCDYGDLVSI